MLSILLDVVGGISPIYLHVLLLVGVYLPYFFAERLLHRTEKTIDCILSTYSNHFFARWETIVPNITDTLRNSISRNVRITKVLLLTSIVLLFAYYICLLKGIIPPIGKNLTIVSIVVNFFILQDMYRFYYGKGNYHSSRYRKYLLAKPKSVSKQAAFVNELAKTTREIEENIRFSMARILCEIVEETASELRNENKFSPTNLVSALYLSKQFEMMQLAILPQDGMSAQLDLPVQAVVDFIDGQQRKKKVASKSASDCLQSYFSNTQQHRKLYKALNRTYVTIYKTYTEYGFTLDLLGYGDFVPSHLKGKEEYFHQKLLVPLVEAVNEESRKVS